LSLVLIVIFSDCHPQTTNDLLNQIFQSKKIILSENYIGDWGSHQNKFIIKANNKNVKILWKNQNLSNRKKNLFVLLPKSALDTLHDIFCNCQDRITNSKNNSTEHTTYKLKTKKTLLVIDDKFTMECYNMFKTWKESVLLESEKRKKKTEQP